MTMEKAFIVYWGGAILVGIIAGLVIGLFDKEK